MRNSCTPGFIWVLTSLVGIASPPVSAVQKADASVTVRGSIEAPSCDQVRLGEIETSLDQEGRFSIVLPLKSANYLDLQCNSALRLFLTPGDDLAVDWQSAGANFSGRGSEANNFLVATKRRATKQEAGILQRYFHLVAGKEEVFVAGMKAIVAQERESLEQFLASHEVDSRFAKVERYDDSGESIPVTSSYDNGFIIYTSSGHMAVHLVRPGRETYAEARQPTPEEAEAAMSTYASYFGPYTIHETDGYVVHHRIGITRPNAIGTDAQRFYELSDNLLILKPPPSTVDGRTVQAKIFWERLGA